MEELKKLIQVKKIIAILLTFTFVYLSIAGIIESKDFMTVFLMIIAFYFGQSTSREAAKEVKK